MVDRKLFLITGVPGAGKTTTGNYLEEKLGYIHIDLEKADFYIRFRSSPDAYIDSLINKNNKIVISWGFHPNEKGVNDVLFLISKQNRPFTIKCIKLKSLI